MEGIPEVKLAGSQGPLGSTRVRAPGQCFFAAEIIALGDKAVAEKLKAFKIEMAEKVEKKDAELQAKGVKKYLDDQKG